MTEAPGEMVLPFWALVPGHRTLAVDSRLLDFGCWMEIPSVVGGFPGGTLGLSACQCRMQET